VEGKVMKGEGKKSLVVTHPQYWRLCVIAALVFSKGTVMALFTEGGRDKL